MGSPSTDFTTSPARKPASAARAARFGYAEIQGVTTTVRQSAPAARDKRIIPCENPDGEQKIETEGRRNGERGAFQTGCAKKVTECSASDIRVSDDELTPLAAFASPWNFT